MNQNNGNKGKEVADDNNYNKNRTIITKQRLLQAQQQTWLPSMETLPCTTCFPCTISLHPHSEEGILFPLYRRVLGVLENLSRIKANEQLSQKWKSGLWLSDTRAHVHCVSLREGRVCVCACVCRGRETVRERDECQEMLFPFHIHAHVPLVWNEDISARYDRSL